MKQRVIHAAIILGAAFLQVHVIGLLGRIPVVLPLFILGIFIFWGYRHLLEAVFPAGLYLDLIIPGFFGIMTLALVATAGISFQLRRIPLSEEHPFRMILLIGMTPIIFFAILTLEMGVISLIRPNISFLQLFTITRLGMIGLVALFHCVCAGIFFFAREIIIRPKCAVIIHH